MIISHANRFVFIKTRKTAGTSVEVSLSRYLAPCDIATEITPSDEEIRREAGCEAQNFIISYGDRMSRLVNHHPVSVAKDFLGPIANRYKFFTIERDPVEQMISLYHFHGAQGDLLDFVRQAPKNPDLYMMDGEIAVDHIIPYDRLERELDVFLSGIGIDWDGWLPRCKSGITPKGAYDITEDLRDNIESLCKTQRWAYDYACRNALTRKEAA